MSLTGVQFPRARLRLDELNLEVSEDCAKMLRKLEQTKSTEDLKTFFKLFGNSR